jgi:uncharacterized phage-associated protein
MIRFNFDKQKFFAVMQIVSEKALSVDILKAMKLLYFIDREHLRKYGRPVLGDHYICMSFGPVPSKAYDQLKDIQSGISPEAPLSVDRTDPSPGGHPTFVSRGSPEYELLSSIELESIQAVIAEHGDKAVGELVELSHEHFAWLKSEKNAPIDYKLFFAENADECRDALEAMVIEQEDRDFVDDI